MVRNLPFELTGREKRAAVRDLVTDLVNADAVPKGEGTLVFRDGGEDSGGSALGTQIQAGSGLHWHSSGADAPSLARLLAGIHLQYGAKPYPKLGRLKSRGLGVFADTVAILQL